MERLIEYIKKDYKRIEAEIDEKRQLDRAALQDEIETLNDECDVIKRTADWSETIMQTAHDASLLEELQDGPSKRLSQELPQKRKPMEMKCIQTPSIEFLHFDYNPNIGWLNKRCDPRKIGDAFGNVSSWLSKPAPPNKDEKLKDFNAMPFNFNGSFQPAFSLSLSQQNILANDLQRHYRRSSSGKKKT